MEGRTGHPVQGAPPTHLVEGEFVGADHGKAVSPMPRILIVTGEASGDLHGANLAKAIMALDSTAELVGIANNVFGRNGNYRFHIPYTVGLFAGYTFDLLGGITGKKEWKKGAG